jgi:formate dehydrogenase subunit gamma
MAESARPSWDDEAAREIVADNRARPGALMPILTRLVERFGYIEPGFVPAIAEALNLSRADVHGVVSFYRDFRTTPPGDCVIRICRAESCQAMQASALIDHAQSRLGITWHETSGDGRFTLEPVYCLGNCACSPAMMVDGELFGRVTPERFDAILAVKAPPSGPPS